MGPTITEHRTAHEQKSLSGATTPYHHEAWQKHITHHDLSAKYGYIPNSLQHGFDAGIPTITCTYTPPNHPSVTLYEEHFNNIISKEFAKGRYLGPFTRAEIENLIGPFQSSPISIILKPGKPGKFRLVQNLSHPYTAKGETSSINSAINSDEHPCTWGTFAVVCLLIKRLPPGSQAAVRDVEEAYRTVPIKPSQWPGLVIRISEGDTFTIDTCNCFGLVSGGGCYGKIGDAGAQLMRAFGIGPLLKWVDDHLFFRILRKYREAYNHSRQQWANDIARNGGEHHDRGRLWFKGCIMPSGHSEEFAEDNVFPIQDFSEHTSSLATDSDYTYGMQDIDRISEELGIPWEKTKDIPFCAVFPFIGFSWDLECSTVSIPQAKKEKYLLAIAQWEARHVHTLPEVQQLYGKLLHSCLVVPSGRAYLTTLERFMANFHDSPFMPRTPPRGTPSDLLWWKNTLSQPTVERPIPGPTPIDDQTAYSDASSEIGIGVTIGNRWRAWRLLPGWKKDGRDIGWAEAVGMLFLATVLTTNCKPATHQKVFGDNRGVVEGWWNGRSRSIPTNDIFKLLHTLSEETQVIFHARYVPTDENPADDPSRGRYGDTTLLIPIPEVLQAFVIDFDAPNTPSELQLIRNNRSPKLAPKKTPAERHDQRATPSHTLEEPNPDFSNTKSWTNT